MRYLVGVFSHGDRAKSKGEICAVPLTLDILKVRLFALEAANDGAAFEYLSREFCPSDPRPLAGQANLTKCRLFCDKDAQTPNPCYGGYGARDGIPRSGAEQRARYTWVQSHPLAAKHVNPIMDYYFGRCTLERLAQRIGPEMAQYATRWR